MDPVALHRKLEPIYEMIDGGNNKAALKSIDRELLSKFPAMQIGRVLRGIVLQRMGRDDEGMDLCESVRLEGPRDDTVLHTLSLFYKNTGRTEQTVAMFEAAAEARPGEPEYLRSLFQSYARAGAFVKQQTCAMKLYRLSNDPKHVMWAVCGALLQTRNGDGPETSAGDSDRPKRDDALMKLASTMCAKLEAGGAVRDRETCLVYARVLRESGKGEKALELLESPLGERCVPMPAERNRLCAAQASVLGAPFAPRAMEHWRAVLESAPDDWEAMSAALDIAMPGTRPAVVRAPSPLAGGAFARRDAHAAAGDAAGDAAGGPGPEALASRVAAAGLDPRAADASLAAGRALVAALGAAADAKGGAKAAGRGAYLLRVELAWRETQLRRSDPSPDAGDGPGPREARVPSLADAIFEYWRAFGAWTSCARDLRPYAELVAPESSRVSLSDALGRAAAEIERDLARDPRGGGAGGDEAAELNRATRRVVAAESVRAALGLCGGSWRDARRSGGVKGLSMPRLASPADGRALARTFIAKYRRARRLVPENADPREPVPGDAFAALGAQALAAEAASWAARGGDASGDDAGVAGDAPGDAEVVMALLACCALSEEALRASPNHAELRLCLVAAYALLGASTAASDALAPLDVKNIQMDTMAHHVLPCAESGCASSVLLEYCGLAERLNADARRDIAEAGVKAYENGAYTKALEFVDFRARLAGSHAARKFAAARARVALREAILALGGAQELRGRETGRFPESLLSVLDEAAEALGPLASNSSNDEFARKFNEDATLNPTFAPPFHGDAGLSACDWWAGHARSPNAETTEDVPVGGAHDRGVGFGVSVAHRAGWARALRRRVVELHALRLAARVADADAGVFEEETENVAAVVAAAEALAEGGRADAAPGDAWARARAPVTAAAARVSDAALRALARLIALRTASGAGAGAAARDAAEAIDAYADAFSSLCGGATAGLLGDASAREPPGPLAERAAARGAVPLLFHAVAEAGATATATLRAYACALAARGCPGLAHLEKGARESLAGAARRASGTVAAAARAAAAAAGAAAADEGKEADALADRVDKWMGTLTSSDDAREGRALRREAYADVARRVIAAHRVTLNAVKTHAERFAAFAEETDETLSR